MLFSLSIELGKYLGKDEWNISSLYFFIFYIQVHLEVKFYHWLGSHRGSLSSPLTAFQTLPFLFKIRYLHIVAKSMGIC